jgi:hypothetical protein
MSIVQRVSVLDSHRRMTSVSCHLWELGFSPGIEGDRNSETKADVNSRWNEPEKRTENWTKWFVIIQNEQKCKTRKWFDNGTWVGKPTTSGKSHSFSLNSVPSHHFLQRQTGTKTKQRKSVVFRFTEAIGKQEGCVNPVVLLSTTWSAARYKEHPPPEMRKSTRPQLLSRESSLS